MKCPKCGVENIDDARFCAECGTSLENRTSIYETDEYNSAYDNIRSENRSTNGDIADKIKKLISSNPSTVLKVFVVALLIILSICIILMIIKNTDEQNSSEPQVATDQNSSEPQFDTEQNTQFVEEPVSADVSIDLPPVSMSAVTNVTATSYLSEKQYELYHEPFNVIDGTLGNAWIEGVNGQGEGESLTIALNGTYTISGFIIYAGYQKSDKTYNNNSRPAELRVSFSNGQNVDIQLDDFFGEQRVSFNSAIESSSITFTILSVYPGVKYQDTAISEITLF